MRRAWAPLFVLGLAQIADQVSIPSLLSLVVSHQQARIAGGGGGQQDGQAGLNVKEVAETVCKIHQFVRTVDKLELESTELGYLKAVVLFSEGNIYKKCCFKTKEAPITNYNFCLSVAKGIVLMFKVLSEHHVKETKLQVSSYFHSSFSPISSSCGGL